MRGIRHLHARWGFLTLGNSPFNTLSPGTVSLNTASHILQVTLNHRTRPGGFKKTKRHKYLWLCCGGNCVRRPPLDEMSLAFTVCHRSFSTSWFHSAETNSSEPAPNHGCSSPHSVSPLSTAHSQPPYRETKRDSPGKQPATSVRRTSLPGDDFRLNNNSLDV